MATFSEYFGLGKSQAELDFVDIDINHDTPLYLDPYALTSREDIWSDKCHDLVTSFFNEVLRAVGSKNKDRAIQLLSRLSEPEETFLGVAGQGNKGRGIGQEQAEQLYDAFLKSKAAQSGILLDLSDFALFIPGIGRDKISDVTTNILRGPLIEYTQQQCDLHNIPMQNVASGFVWDPENLIWKQGFVGLPVIDSKKRILVPKYAVRYQVGVDYRKYYNNFVLNFLRDEHLRAQDSLVHTLKNEKQKVYKKELKLKYPDSKDFLSEFSVQHPDVIDNYREHLRLSTSRIPNIDSENFREDDLANYLIQKLSELKPGQDDANAYHNLCIGILSFLFFPNLINPKKEAEINQGRKRIDILYTNSMERGVFYRMAANKQFNANIIPVECKNYTKDPKNPELDQLMGRFSRERGKIGFLVYRSTQDIDALIARCRDVVHAGNGCILPMDDDFLIMLLNEIANERRKYIERHVDELYRKIIS